MATKIEMAAKLETAKLESLITTVEKLEKKVDALDSELRALKARPVATPSAGVDEGLKAELTRVASLVDRIVSIIRSPTARITDRSII